VEVDELLVADGGVWTVTTVDSSYWVGLDEETVTRHAPAGATTGLGDRRHRRAFWHCTVGRRGYWTLDPGAGDPEHSSIWHRATVVLSIDREDDDDCR
jgi:hypothetical protein